jgi:hypothetical protein
MPCCFAYRVDFAGICVCHTDLSGGGGVGFPPPHADLPTDLLAIQPTGREGKG